MTLGSQTRGYFVKRKTEYPPQGVRCQRCLEYGHWSYECKGKRKYLHRSSRTQQLKKRLKVSTAENIMDTNGKKSAEKRNRRQETESDSDSDSESSEESSDGSSTSDSESGSTSSDDTTSCSHSSSSATSSSSCDCSGDSESDEPKTSSNET